MICLPKFGEFACRKLTRVDNLVYEISLCVCVCVSVYISMYFACTFLCQHFPGDQTDCTCDIKESKIID
jgi:hypothetical protein